ncbi:MAG: glycosyltransferase [Mangrovicoccus sp.]
MTQAQPKPLSVVMLTPLDYLSAFNNREHNAIRYYRGQGDHVVLIGKKLNRRPGMAAALRDGLTCRIERAERDGAEIRLCDPFLNFFGGIAKQSKAQAASEAKPSLTGRIKARLISVLKPLSLLRELAAVASQLVAAWGPAGRADLVMGFGPWGALPGLLLKYLGRANCLVYVDRDYEAGLFDDQRGRITAALERKLPQKSDIFVTIGPRLQKLRLETTGREPLLCETGVTAANFAAAHGASPASGQVEILYVGNVIEWSGVELVIRAMGELPARLRFRVIGSGLPGYMNELAALAESLGVADRVEFVGPIAHVELPGAMAGASLGFAASRPNLYRQYAYPLKVLEYMAAGLPVLATKDTEAADIVARAQAGFSFDYDVTALRDALDRLLAQPQLLTQMRTNALAAAQGMSWERSFDRERGAIMDQLRGQVG